MYNPLTDQNLKANGLCGEDCKTEIAEVRPKMQIHMREKTQIGQLL
jgi:hypothetical protein